MSLIYWFERRSYLRSYILLSPRWSMDTESLFLSRPIAHGTHAIVQHTNTRDPVRTYTRHCSRRIDSSMKEIKIILPLEAVATPRPRVSFHRGKSQTYYPKKYRDFKAAARLFLRHTYRNISIDAENLLHTDYLVVLTRPKYMHAKKYPDGLIPHQKRPDRDNLTKSIDDVLEDAGIYKDDSVNWSNTTKKMYSERDTLGRIEITIQIKNAGEQPHSPAKNRNQT